MLRNYILTSFRSLIKNKVYTSLNIVGLALCFVAVFFIVQFVHFEQSFDDFHQKKDRIFRVGMQLSYNSSSSTSAGSYYGLGKIASEEFSQIENYFTTTFNNDDSGFLGREGLDGSKNFRLKGVYYATPSILDVLDFNFLEGSNVTGLTGTSTVVITKRLATKMFGNSVAVGQPVTWYNTSSSEITKTPFLVGAVIEDLPDNTQFEFDLIMPMETFQSFFPEYIDNIWRWYGYYNYIQLRSPQDHTYLTASYPRFLKKHFSDRNSKSEPPSIFLEPLTAIHLNSKAQYQIREGGDQQTINILILISIFLLVLAYTNYLNLVTSVNLQRAKEVGIRKIIGSTKKHIVFQFLTETLLVTITAVFAALLCIYILKDMVPNWVDNFPEAYLLSNPIFWALSLTTIGIISLLIGLYPSIVVSQFKNIEVIKGDFNKSGKGNMLHRCMVVLQFTIASFLIFFTFVVNDQLQFMFNTSSGADIDQVIVARAPLVRNGSSAQSIATFKNQAKGMIDLKTVSASTMVPGMPRWGNSISIEGKSDDRQVVRRMEIDEDYLDTYRHELVAGRNFSLEFGTDDQSVIINEKTAEMFGLPPNEIVQKTVYVYPDTFNIIGVIKNYHHNSLKSETLPMIATKIDDNIYYLSMRVDTKDLSRTIAQLSAAWEEHFPESSFDYFFADENFNQLYAKEQKLGKIVSLFTMAAVLIASLGIFGLSLFTLFRKRKEISIRKVLGASDKHLFWVFSKDILLLILIASVISLPLSYLAIEGWLDSFANRIGINAIHVITPVLITIFFVGVTLGYNILKALSVNPTESLRSE